MRLTKNRKILLTELEKGEVLTAQELHRKVSEIDLATVYRNLNLFVEEGLVRELQISKDEVHYEFIRDHHHHAICDDCGKVYHFAVDEQSLQNLLHLQGFDVNSVELKVKGKCS
ncbi:transcriptional repressor [Candidatus Dojkabacteria bacterium]|uniref:Transcriptional repressor n=1 Tax=Candidatus Dojkabacteria bacterium TaxID=2099670 RepID=A0A955L853_9BACT|nr:transcriptional repressor [Candidatus Dojkabacteria bacterium]